ncbi:MAG: HDOD domain-containing protein [Verrucomicrobia bacterium]|nr:HDOD domain-containing protein [Verrucomicrobiota bacterium]
MKSVAVNVITFSVWLLIVILLTITLLKLHQDVETARTRQVEVLESARGETPPDVSHYENEVQAKHNLFNTVGILLVVALVFGLVVFTIWVYRLAAAARDAREVLEFRGLSAERSGLVLDEEEPVITEPSYALPDEEVAPPPPAHPEVSEPEPLEQAAAPAPPAQELQTESETEEEPPAPEALVEVPVEAFHGTVTMAPQAPPRQRTALDDVLDALAPPDPERRRYFERLRHAGLRFPALTGELARLLDVVAQPRTYMHQLVREISRHPALAQKLIRFANTLVFAPPKPVQNLNLALVVLGADGLRSGVVAQGVHDAFDFSRPVQVELWHEAIAAASAATLVGRAAHHGKPAALHALGLASALGSMVLLHNRPEEYGRLADLQFSEHVDAHDVEREAFGSSGAEVGAVALAVWRLPAWMQGAVMYAHDLEAPGLQRFGREATVAAAVLDAASAVARTVLGMRTLGATTADLKARASIRQLGLNQHDLDDVAQDLRDMYAEQRSFL